MLQWGRGVEAAEIEKQHAVICRYVAASMGPRRRSRGNRGKRFRQVKQALLQWGRGVEAAEIADDLSDWAPPGMLQWGRGVEAAEIRPSQPADRRDDASMGPRRRSRGNLHWLAHADETLPASMGPRRRSRGNDAERASQFAIELLQWGRGVEAAEIRGPRTVEFHGWRLQWGRGVEAAEIRPSQPADRRDDASMGPRRRSRGNLHWLAHADETLPASMGPRRRSRGNDAERASQFAIELLQWGRGVEAAEIGRDRGG